MKDFTSQRYVFATGAFALVVALHVALPTVMEFASALLFVCVSAVALMRAPVAQPVTAVIDDPETDHSLRLLEAELHAQMDQCHTDLARLDAGLRGTFSKD